MLLLALSLVPLRVGVTIGITIIIRAAFQRPSSAQQRPNPLREDVVVCAAIPAYARPEELVAAHDPPFEFFDSRIVAHLHAVQSADAGGTKDTVRSEDEDGGSNCDTE
jgi:hypothetical protein